MIGIRKKRYTNRFVDCPGRYRRIYTIAPRENDWSSLRDYFYKVIPAYGWVDMPYPGTIPTDQDPMPTEYYERLMAAWQPYLGMPYIKGGKSPSDGGFDCSGFVAYVCKQAGLMDSSVTAYTYSIMLYCEFVQSSLLADDGRAPGDIMYWSRNPGWDECMNAHVAIYIGNNYCVESSYNGCAYGPITAHSTPFRGYYRLPRPYPIEQ